MFTRFTIHWWTMTSKLDHNCLPSQWINWSIVGQGDLGWITKFHPSSPLHIMYHPMNQTWLGNPLAVAAVFMGHLQHDFSLLSIYMFIYLFILLFIYSFIYGFIHLFIYFSARENHIFSENHDICYPVARRELRLPCIHIHIFPIQYRAPFGST